MDLGLKDKVALIGGSSRGLGYACAASLAKEGVKVVITGRGEKQLGEAKLALEKIGGEVLALRADLNDPKTSNELISKTIEKFGGLDILVINSGGPKPGGFFDLSEQDWLTGFNGVLGYYIKLIRSATPLMQSKSWGRIITLTSSTVKEPSESLVISNAFRSSITALTRTLAKELIQDGITINNVLPGAFRTERAVELLELKARSQGKNIAEVEKELIETLPLGRWHEPEELGDLVCFLASKQAAGISGANITMDGLKQRGVI